MLKFWMHTRTKSNGLFMKNAINEYEKSVFVRS